MALFPRFGTKPPAKVAKPATVERISRDDAANFRNCRNFSSPTGLDLQKHTETDDDLAQRVASLADAYAERIAMVMEVGDIGEADARRIAEAEIGAAFVRAFLPGTMHSALTASTAQTKEDHSTLLDCAPNTKSSGEST